MVIFTPTRIALICIPSYFIFKSLPNPLIDSSAKMTFNQRWKQAGLRSQKYFITTEDGYILQLFRIIADGEEASKTPVYFQHGSQDSAMWWIANKDNSAPFVLAKNGFDVWVANSRGWSFSRMHRDLDPDIDHEYWDFSFQDMAKYDTKAVVEWILKNNANSKIGYIGHSQGCAVILCALAEDYDWYKDKLFMVVAWAPATRMANMKVEYLKKVWNNKFIEKLADRLDIKAVNEPNKYSLSFLCSFAKIWPRYMEWWMRRLHDADPKVNDLTSVQIFWYYHPNGTSFKSLRHWSQIIKQGEFRKFSYSKEKNLEVYGTESSPIIDISRIKDIPIALLWGKFDLLATPEDVKWTRDQLNSNNVSNNFIINH